LLLYSFTLGVKDSNTSVSACMGQVRWRSCSRLSGHDCAQASRPVHLRAYGQEGRQRGASGI